MKINYTLPKEGLYTFAPCFSNQITKAYYDFLVGEINRGTIKRAVCRIENNRRGSINYYLISVR